MKEKISAVYQIRNMITGERYVGSSKNVKRRWANHKCPSMRNKYPNSQMYKDMQEYGIENFMFAILAPVEEEHLKQVEQEFIEMLNPAYNQVNANGWDVERRKTYRRAYLKAYSQTEKGKASKRKAVNKCRSQLCKYNGETLTLNALTNRFYRAGIPHAMSEAKKYLISPTN